MPRWQEESTAAMTSGSTFVMSVCARGSQQAPGALPRAIPPAGCVDLAELLPPLLLEPRHLLHVPCDHRIPLCQLLRRQAGSPRLLVVHSDLAAAPSAGRSPWHASLPPACGRDCRHPSRAWQSHHPGRCAPSLHLVHHGLHHRHHAAHQLPQVQWRCRAVRGITLSRLRPHQLVRYLRHCGGLRELGGHGHDALPPLPTEHR
mmetsp:Transcript_19076/g.53163  ORF Transcript_19076/g.53163 Transcript_19076/m.53163 type:complete len:203 (-) Transcript_19076:1656-2264(-)